MLEDNGNSHWQVGNITINENVIGLHAMTILNNYRHGEIYGSSLLINYVNNLL